MYVSILPHTPTGASVVAQLVRKAPATQEAQVQSLDRDDHLEKEMATQSSILAWKMPWTENLVGCSPRGHKSQT